MTDDWETSNTSTPGTMQKQPQPKGSIPLSFITDGVAAGDNLNCNITLTDARPVEEQGRIDGEEEPTSPELQHRTPARSDTSHTSEPVHTPSIAEEPKNIYVHEEEPAVEEITRHTASLSIPDPIKMVTQTYIEEPTPLVIDERTGHIVEMHPEDVQAARRAMGPDKPDLSHPPEVQITEEEDEESLRLDADETYEVARMLSTDDHFIVDNNTGDVIRLGMCKSESRD
ncbi:hypothetical protein EI94DRAFT_1799945 [Lactarius quietus]|nr:hypothetical protein EI94DRAFT_1799945 [Lactarius quietus]